MCCVVDKFKKIELIREKVQNRVVARPKIPLVETFGRDVDQAAEGIPLMVKNVRHYPRGLVVAAGVPAKLVGRY